MQGFGEASTRACVSAHNSRLPRRRNCGCAGAETPGPARGAVFGSSANTGTRVASDTPPKLQRLTLALLTLRRCLRLDLFGSCLVAGTRGAPCCRAHGPHGTHDAHANGEDAPGSAEIFSARIHLHVDRRSVTCLASSRCEV